MKKGAGGRWFKTEDTKGAGVYGYDGNEQKRVLGEDFGGHSGDQASIAKLFPIYLEITAGKTYDAVHDATF